MKLIVAGTRTLDLSRGFIEEIVDFYIPLEMELKLVCGMCKGIDQIAYDIWKFQDMSIKEFPADWEAHGKAAGPIRNKEMANYADALLLIWDGKSKGSANMKKEMEKLNKTVYEVIIKSCK